MKCIKASSDTFELPEVECYNLEYISDKEMRELIEWIHIIRRIQHKNLMIIKDISLQDSCINIISNISKYGSMENIMKNNDYKCGISCELLISSVVYQICEGLQYLHYNMNVIHRGICPNAVFIDGKGLVKLGKFNNCIKLNSEATKSTDFPTRLPHLIAWYSPELIEQEFYGYSYNSDVYSVGLLIGFMFTGKLPYDDCEPPLILLKKISLVDIPNLQVSSNRSNTSLLMQEFVNLSLLHNPRDRPNVHQILSHPWLQARTHCSKSTWKQFINE